MRVSGVLLAAGASTRFGSPKMLAPVPPDGRPMLAHVIDTWRGAGFAEIVVVVGSGSDAVRGAARPLDAGAPPPVRFVENTGWASGMFSSVRSGLATVSPASTHVALSPADLPFLSRESLRTVLSAAASLDAGGLSLVVPTHAGRRGHPLLLPAALVARVLSWPHSARLNQLFEEPDVTVHRLEGFDATILQDVDEPTDLQQKLSLSS